MLACLTLRRTGDLWFAVGFQVPAAATLCTFFEQAGLSLCRAPRKVVRDMPVGLFVRGSRRGQEGTEDQALPGFTLWEFNKPRVRSRCVEDSGMEDLEARKVYQVLPDREASREGYVRVVDESGEDYVYPSDLFVPVKLPAAVVRRFKRRTETSPPATRRSIRRSA